jgi:hypothetical protein
MRVKKKKRLLQTKTNQLPDSQCLETDTGVKENIFFLLVGFDFLFGI